MNQRPLICSALALTVFIAGASAAAAAWTHAAAPGGQFEGGATGQGVSLSYGCSGIGSGLRISVPGDHAGPVQVSVDGRQITSFDLAYRANFGESIVDLNAKTSPRKAELNRMIDALASGRQMTAITADGQTASLSLSGSAQIRRCRAQ